MWKIIFLIPMAIQSVKQFAPQNTYFQQLTQYWGILTK